MFPRRSAAVLLTTGLLCFASFGPTPAHADDPIGRLSLSANFGVSSFAMGDVNDEIKRGNIGFFDAKNLSNMDDLSYGFNFLADFKTAIRDPFFLSVGAGSIRGHTGVSFNQIVDVDSRASFFYGRILYALPWRPLENGRLFAGGGPVFLRNVEFEVSHERDLIAKRPERQEVLTMTGDGSGFQFDLIGEYLLSDHVTVALDFGYRNATATLDALNPAEDIQVNNAETRPGQDAHDDNDQIFWDSYLIEAFLEDPGELQEDLDGPLLQDLESVDGLERDFSGVRFEVGLRIYFF